MIAKHLLNNSLCPLMIFCPLYYLSFLNLCFFSQMLHYLWMLSSVFRFNFIILDLALYLPTLIYLYNARIELLIFVLALESISLLKMTVVLTLYINIFRNIIYGFGVHSIDPGLRTFLQFLTLMLTKNVLMGIVITLKVF